MGTKCIIFCILRKGTFYFWIRSCFGMELLLLVFIGFLELLQLFTPYPLKERNTEWKRPLYVQVSRTFAKNPVLRSTNSTLMYDLVYNENYTYFRYNKTLSNIRRTKTSCRKILNALIEDLGRCQDVNVAI